MTLDELKTQNLLKPLNSAEELRGWVSLYLGIELPFDTIDSESTSNPIDAMWTVYCAVRDNKGEHVPGYIFLSAREAFKTLGASILEILIMLHFQSSIGHMAAIQSQSDQAMRYIDAHLRKLDPMIAANGWQKLSDSKTFVQYSTPEGNKPYIILVICTLQGANALHPNILFIDEIDVVRDPLAYEEAKLIPAMERGRFPLTVGLSTRKFAFGMMAKEVENAPKSGIEIKRWNILDIAERCPKSRHEPDPDGKKMTAYVARSLPLQKITEEEFQALQESKKESYERAEGHPGCMKCPIFPVCKGKLADKPKTAKKGLYRPIGAIINSFKKISPDMAEAQLLCWKPSSKGLVYPRFDATFEGNIKTVDMAYRMIAGEDPPANLSLDQFVAKGRELGGAVHAGVDWGYTHEATIVIVMSLQGVSFVLETFGAPGLELQDFTEEAIKYKEKFGIIRFWCDQANPGNIKTFNKKGLISPDFKKDVMAGIEAIRGQVIDSTGKRRFFVLQTESNQKLLQGFRVHHFILDAAGNPTKNPDDEEFADVMDALRYIGQNLYTAQGTKPVIGSAVPLPNQDLNYTKPFEKAGEALKDVINQKMSETGDLTTKSSKNKRIVWSG